jgi:O-antigen ligase
MEAWKVTLEMAWQEPFIGLGLANYYHYAVLFPILGWRVKFSSHNNYLDLLAQSGVLGLAAFAWLSFELLRVVLRLYSDSPSGFPRAYAAGAAAGFVAVLVSGMLGDWVIPFVYNTGVSGFRSSLVTWLFIGGALALDSLLKERRTVDPVLT